MSTCSHVRTFARSHVHQELIPFTVDALVPGVTHQTIIMRASIKTAITILAPSMVSCDDGSGSTSKVVQRTAPPACCMLHVACCMLPVACCILYIASL